VPWWENLLLGFGPTLLFIGLLVLLMRRAGNVQNVLGNFGRAGARRYQPSSGKVTFEDVAGVEEAEQELAEVVDFLRHPEKYRRLGGRIPHGVLLTGPPGTGKTLLARAVAGEANAPFYSMAASEFVEAIVGVGAARVRDLFTRAKAEAPAIVFIDELDAIGRSRTSGIAGFSGGNDEREQTLNQILTEMDGFDSSTGVIVIAATNRPEILDSALLRPGRFDRRVAVQPPDRAGREAILKVHTRGMPLADDVELGRIAASTPGMVGADLANLVNEAALLAARRSHELIMESDFTDSLERIILGAERQIMMSEADRRRTAYHEAGHALVGMLTPGADPVRKISIIPRGMALGVTFAAPETDRFNYEERELKAKIGVALGGRAAEELVYGEPTTGAESDIQQLTEIVRQMVSRWGMSPAIGPLAVAPVDGRGPYYPGGAEVSERTQELIDEEMRRIVDESHGQVARLLAAHRDQLDALAEALLEHETLDEDDAYAAAGVARNPDESSGRYTVAARNSG
jgi:cell division protease FtsH